MHDYTMFQPLFHKQRTESTCIRSDRGDLNFEDLSISLRERREELSGIERPDESRIEVLLFDHRSIHIHNSGGIPEQPNRRDCPVTAI